MEGDAVAHQLIAFAGRRHKAFPITDRDLLSAARNQAAAFQLAGRIGNGRPLHAEHFGEKDLTYDEPVFRSSARCASRS